MIILATVNKKDKRTIEEYMKDLDGSDAAVRGFLNGAVLTGVCSLDDNVNDGLDKIKAFYQNQKPVG